MSINQAAGDVQDGIFAHHFLSSPNDEPATAAMTRKESNRTIPRQRKGRNQVGIARELLDSSTKTEATT